MPINTSPLLSIIYQYYIATIIIYVSTAGNNSGIIIISSTITKTINIQIFISMMIMTTINMVTSYKNSIEDNNINNTPIRKYWIIKEIPGSPKGISSKKRKQIFFSDASSKPPGAYLRACLQACWSTYSQCGCDHIECGQD